VLCSLNGTPPSSNKSSSVTTVSSSYHSRASQYHSVVLVIVLYLPNGKYHQTSKFDAVVAGLHSSLSLTTEKTGSLTPRTSFDSVWHTAKQREWALSGNHRHPASERLVSTTTCSSGQCLTHETAHSGKHPIVAGLLPCAFSIPFQEKRKEAQLRKRCTRIPGGTAHHRVDCHQQ